MTDMSAPEKIWFLPYEGSPDTGRAFPGELKGTVEYTRSDLAHARGKQEPVADDPEWVARASASISEMVWEWYRSPLGGVRDIPGDLILRRLERFTPPAEREEVARLKAALNELVIPSLVVKKLPSWARETVRAALAASPAPVDHFADAGKPITFIYRNWRGEVAERTVIPKRIWWGATEWHPEPQWLMSGADVEKGAERDFALKDMQFVPAIDGGEDE